MSPRGVLHATLAAALVAPALVGHAPAPRVYSGPGFTITADAVREGARHAEVVSGTALVSNDAGEARTRELKRDLAGLPRLRTDHRLLDFLHRQALEEALDDVRPDGALMAGREWPGVWTRDVCYSTHLALALVLPDAARRSLLAKTFDGRVRQDTGTGGAWPVSTDRVVWTVAAWELYETTGDAAWLASAYALAGRMAEEDWRVARDAATGLMRGESSFMDWREQTYPAWMEPVDIYGARALGTNVLHAEAYADLARMARTLGRRQAEARRWEARGAGIRAAIGRALWDERAGLYRAFVYPEPDGAPSAQTEALGNSLAVLFDVADARRARRVMANYPVFPFGAPTIYPQQPFPAQPYHNKAVWPFVESYRALAGARAGNAAAFSSGLANVMRAAALFQTNKENFVYDSGRAEGTAVNSDRQLWSVAGFLALVYKGLLGLQLAPDGIRFRPTVPAWVGRHLAVEGLRVRRAILDVEVVGSGTTVRAMSLDGRAWRPDAPLPYALVGRHRVRLQLDGEARPSRENGRPAGEAATAPAVPEGLAATLIAGGGVSLRWKAPAVGAGLTYTVVRDGVAIATARGASFTDRAAGRRPHAYTNFATDAAGLASGHARPRSTAPAGTAFAVPSPRTDRWGTPGTAIPFTVRVPAAGRYALRLRYANGAGPINTDSKCALRSLYVDGRRLGAAVLPQRGVDAWDAWGLSNPLAVRLARGTHQVEVRFDPADRNMDEAVNVARVGALEVALTAR